MKDTSTIITNTSRQIKSSKRNVTILFTDIEESTKYWHRFGDVEGRLMVDRHNRLLFPVVGKFKGRVIKTIGDSIMAAFATPDNAIKAAIAMQQTMAMERQGDDSFRIRIRIGIHTGDAIVEQGDVYGDVVNVASRVESKSKGNQILISQTTVARIDDEYAFIFKRKGRFVPKGKDKGLVVYTCDWKNHPLLIDEIIKSSNLPVSKNLKFKLGIYFASTLAIFYFIYLKYLRYLISDSEELALLYLNFRNIIENYPYFVGGFTLTLIILSIVLLRIHTLPLIIMRFVKGGFIFSVSFMLIYLLAQYAPINQEEKWNEVLDSSIFNYVEVLEDNSSIYLNPSLKGKEIQQMQAGHLLLQSEFKEIGQLAWNRVLLGAEKYGWIVQVSPPQMGIPEKTVSQNYRFHFRYKDLYTFAFGLLCFLIGFLKFRIRPI